MTNSALRWCDATQMQALAASAIKSTAVVLDIGCGIRPQQFITPELLICIEPHLEYVELLKKNLAHTRSVILPLDALQALKAMPDSSVDSIFLIDVIEHMDKATGQVVLGECERVARQQIILFTPLGYMPQEIHAGEVDGWNLHGGKWQIHKSGWYPEDFAGWDIYATNQLHAFDFKGQPIKTSYGGFYAIKSIVKTNNHFNDVYAKAVIADSTDNLFALKRLFPQFIEQVVYREMDNSQLKCALISCQRTTELLIEKGDTNSVDHVYDLLRTEREQNSLEEARKFNTRISEFAAQFLTAQTRESLMLENERVLTAREVKIADRESNLLRIEADADTKQQALASQLLISDEEKARLNIREQNLSLREAKLIKANLEFENLIWLRIARKLRLLK